MTAPVASLTIPFATLVQDNHRFLALRIGRGARLVLAPGYRAGKAAIAAMAADVRPAVPPFTICPLRGPLALVGVLYPPDRRKRDQRNYAKAITDALSGVWYDDDSQLVGELWLKGAPSKAHARMELHLFRACDVPALTRLCAPAPDHDHAPAHRPRRGRAA